MNGQSIFNIRSDVIFMVKFIQKTDILEIWPGHSSPEGSEFVNLFAKSFTIMNTKVPLNYDKKRARRNWD